MKKRIEITLKIILYILVSLFFAFYFYTEEQQTKYTPEDGQVLDLMDIIVGSIMYLILIPALIKWLGIEKGPERAPLQVKREEKEYHKDINKSFKNNKKHKNYARRK
jgi:hypothetical protein